MKLTGEISTAKDADRNDDGKLLIVYNVSILYVFLHRAGMKY